MDLDESSFEGQKIIILHHYEKQFQVKFFTKTTAHELLENVYEVLGVNHSDHLVFTDWQGKRIQIDGKIEEGSHITVTQFKPMQKSSDLKKKKRPVDAKVYLLWDKNLSKGGKIFKESEGDYWQQVYLVPGWTGQKLPNKEEWF